MVNNKSPCNTTINDLKSQIKQLTRINNTQRKMIMLLKRQINTHTRLKAVEKTLRLNKSNKTVKYKKYPPDEYDSDSDIIPNTETSEDHEAIQEVRLNLNE